MEAVSQEVREPAGVGVQLFNRPALIVALGALAAGAWFGQALLVVLSGTVLAAALVTRLWSRLSLVRVAYRRRLGARRAFPGEEIQLAVILENRKPLPLAWVEAVDRIPLPARPVGGDTSPDAAAAEPGPFGVRTSLLWYQRARWRYRLVCRRRGWYDLGPVEVSSADIFGLIPRSRQDPAPDRIIVYPRIYDLAQLGLPSRHPLGEARSDLRIFADPTRAIGLRQYSSDAPFKHIHWKASARRQQLQVKTFEPTTTLQVALFLDVDGFDAQTDPAGDDFELAVSVAASLAHHVAAQRHAVGIFVNAACPGRDGPVGLRPASGLDHMAAILENLAGIQARHTGPFPEFLDGARADLTWGATVGLITADLTEAVYGRMLGLLWNGFRVVVYLLGDRPVPSGPLPCHRVARPADLAAPGRENLP